MYREDPDLDDNLTAAMHTVLDGLVAEITVDAKRFVPIDTSALQQGITPEWAEGRVARVWTRRPPGTPPASPGDSPHVPGFIEYGTDKMEPRPYMRPALYQRRPI